MGKSETAEFVGVTEGWLLPSDALKQQALMFDRLAVVYLSQALKSLRSGAHPRPELAAEIDWLVDQRLLYEPDFFPSIENLNRNPRFARYLKEFVRLDKKMERAPVSASPRKALEYLISHVRQHDLILRLMSVQLRELE